MDHLRRVTELCIRKRQMLGVAAFEFDVAPTAGIGLSIKHGQVVFFHRWVFLKATKPSRH
jgi:hypothetical protein